MKPEGRTETVSDIKPGHPVWDEIWRRSTPDCQDYASHLTQLLEVSIKYAALQQANERMRKALDGLVASAITCCPEYLSLVANGKRDNETIQGWALGDWKKLNAALDIARAALAEAGGEEHAQAR